LKSGIILATNIIFVCGHFSLSLPFIRHKDFVIHDWRWNSPHFTAN